VELLGLEFLAAFIHLHLGRQREGDVKLDLLARLLEGHGEVARLAGDAGDHGPGLDLDVGEVAEFLDFGLDHRGRGLFEGVLRGQLLAPLGRIAAQGGLLFDDGDLVAGLGGVDGGRDAGDAPADHQDPAREGFQLVAARQVDLLDLGQPILR
jgi:hypothetical protein